MKEAVIHKSKEKVLQIIRDAAVIPVVRVSTREEAICAVEGVVKGGIPIAEITMTIPNALDIVKQLVKRFGGNLLVGAGTVLDAAGCDLAIAAGADFIVSPALNSEVVKTAARHKTLCIPGALTPTEVLSAWQGGGDLVKIFPCGAVGGPAYIKALRGPFPQIEFVVTGSVTLENVPDFLAAGTVAVGVGEGILERDALQKRDAGRVSENARRFADVARRARSTLLK